MNLKKTAVILSALLLLTGCVSNPVSSEEKPAPVSDIVENIGDREDLVREATVSIENNKETIIDVQEEKEEAMTQTPEPAKEDKDEVEPEEAPAEEKVIEKTPEPEKVVEAVKKEEAPAPAPVVEKPKEPAYTIKPMTGTRYTTSPLNVRKGPGTGFAVVKSIGKGTEVALSGKTDTGWYQIKEGFVSGKYLSEKKPVVEAPKPAAPDKPSYSPYRIYLPYKTVAYKNGGTSKGQSVIDAQPSLASTWGGAGTFSGTDGQNTHFIGHDYSAFKGLWNVDIGQTITITDGNGTPFRYKVTRKFVVDDYGKGVSDGQQYYNYITGTRGGEVVTFQTCKTKTTNWILRGELIH